MQIKKYEAMNMQEALRLVKNDLGSDAVILSSRKTKRGGRTFGILGRTMVEVTAAIDFPSPPASPGEKTREGSQGPLPLELFLREDIQGLKNEIQQLLKAGPVPALVEDIKKEISGLRRSLTRLQDPSYSPVTGPPAAVPDPWREIYGRYIDGGIEEDLARRMIGILERQAGNPDEHPGSPSIPGTACEMILRQTRVHGPLLQPGKERTAAVFVGPTGAGKTTTLAKIAAGYSLGPEPRKVALITLDTYRIAAVEQLKIYAKIIGAPVEVALSPDELRAIFRKYPETELFLIDTAGRNQKDESYLSELSAYFDPVNTGRGEGAPILKGHLVLPATLRSDVLADAVRRYGVLPIQSLLFTKLDEVDRYGQIFNVMIRGQKPLSYFTTGQRVPEDIELATPGRLAQLIAG
jgi:flagellar biosynthesis protein FlhF